MSSASPVDAMALGFEAQAAVATARGVSGTAQGIAEFGQCFEALHLS
jgi:hypothetical protein